MVVVPAGTRNHLALDLGLDRDDVVGALDAYGAAVERTMTLADVNGRVFVNNVSLGLYAAIVRSPSYRDAKVDTTLSTLPQVLGPGTEPFDLRFDRTRRRGASRRARDPGLQRPLRDGRGRAGSTAPPGHGPAGCRRPRAGQAGRSGGLPRRPRHRPSRALRGPHVVGRADVRGDVRRADRDRARRGERGPGSAAALLGPSLPRPGAAADARDRVLPRGPLARSRPGRAQALGYRPGAPRFRSAPERQPVSAAIASRAADIDG